MRSDCWTPYARIPEFRVLLASETFLGNLGVLTHKDSTLSVQVKYGYYFGNRIK